MSIRWRLTAWYTGIMAISLAALAIESFLHDRHAPG